MAVYSNSLGSGSTPYYPVWFSIFLWSVLYVEKSKLRRKKVPVVLYFNLLISRV